MTIKEIRDWSGMTQLAFSQYTGIPKRTIENWEQGKRTAPEYLLKMLERIVKEDLKKEAR